MFANAEHYYKKIQSVGVLRAWNVIHHRFFKRSKHGPITWNMIAQKHGVTWQQFYTALQKQEPLSSYPTALLRATKDTVALSNATVDEYVSCEKLSWFEDAVLKARDPKADYTFDSVSYYKDIRITTTHMQDLGKDVKEPWERARFQHFPLLAHVYTHAKNKKYLDAISAELEDWIACNPYGYGIHWVNPMEVGIRVTNWIVALDILKDSDHAIVERRRIKRLVVSIYEHMQYLEHNWELYDGRTNNHYLSNLVGYLYCCYFFQSLNIKKKIHWVVQELLREFEWQVFDEGTSYEGSTTYHVLVTELFTHGFELAQKFGYALDELILQKLSRMQAFIDHCTPHNATKVITIGDDDSGSLLHPFLQIKEAAIHNEGVSKFYYPQFGLSIYKDTTWHASLRHHSYHARQPSAHFHDDAGSMTLSYKGIAILVDPGSYVYTASRVWRNRFRSASMHNRWYHEDHATITHHELFELPQQERTNTDSYMKAQYALEHNRLSTRSIAITSDAVTIQDSFNEGDSGLECSLVFHPDIELKQRDAMHWQIMHYGMHILTLQTDVVCTQKTAWYAPEYGRKQKSAMLVGNAVSRKSNFKFCKSM